MKKIVAVLILLIFALSACDAGGDDSDVTNPDDGVEIIVYRSPT